MLLKQGCIWWQNCTATPLIVQPDFQRRALRVIIIDRIDKGKLTMTEVESSVYERVGGDPVFERIVDMFYARVEADPVLRPMFPEDLTEGKRWQFLFLTQFFGGPARYAVERGHPRLRMRHSPFPIDQQARDHWLTHMLAAIDAAGVEESARNEMRDYFERAATFMINREAEADNLMHYKQGKSSE
jgi:hemoglobin